MAKKGHHHNPEVIQLNLIQMWLKISNGKITWIIQVSPKCNHMYPCKRKVDLYTEKEKTV